jgi:hypothetical protein
VDVNLTDAQPHLVTLHLVDWDYQGRTEQVQVLDTKSGAVLASRTVSNFSGGEYLSFMLQGHVTLRFTNVYRPQRRPQRTLLRVIAGFIGARYPPLTHATEGGIVSGGKTSGGGRSSFTRTLGAIPK